MSATLGSGGDLERTTGVREIEQIVKFVVMKGGGAAPGQSDREFTDWNALAHFVDVFLDAATKRGT